MTGTKVKVTERHWLSGIWLLPLIAALMSGWVIYQNALEKGIEISIIFNDAAGVRAEKTQIMYKGVSIGVVKSVNMSDNFKQVKVTAEIHPSSKNALRESTRFWLVKPTVSLTEITGLDTLVSGNYIKMQLGKEGKEKKIFTALESPPTLEQEDNAGLHIDLFVARLGSIVRSSKVYFREIPVGEVLDYALSPTEEGVILKLRIEEHYAALVKKSSRFWNASGLSVKVGLSQVSVRSESLASLISGGVAFYNPSSANEVLAKDGDSFQLYEDFEAAEVEFDPKLIAKTEAKRFVHITANELGSISIGSAVYFKKMPVGEVINYRLSPRDNLIITLEVQKKYAHLIHKKTRFWRNSGLKIKAGLSGVDVEMASVKALLNGGISFSDVSGKRSYRAYKNRRYYPLYEDQEQARELVKNITIRFDLSKGVDVGTAIKYLGIKVGAVTAVQLAKDNQSIIAQAKLIGSATDFAREGAKFWVIAAEVGLFNTKHLDTLIKGNYLQIKPGKGKKQAQFEGELFFPAIKSGVHLRLIAPQLGSVKIGQAVSYRQIKVGEVVSFALGNQAQNVLIDIEIAQKYAVLVQPNTKFWNASGLKVDIGLFSGAEIRADSVESIILGGIAFATPNTPSNQTITENSLFQLHDDYQPEWLQWSPAISLSRSTL